MSGPCKFWYSEEQDKRSGHNYVSFSNFPRQPYTEMAGYSAIDDHYTRFPDSVYLGQSSNYELECSNDPYVPKKEPRMKIGQYEVTEVSRDSAKVGCQLVTRAEAQALVQEMDKAPTPQFHLGSEKPGAIWLEIMPNKSVVELHMRGPSGQSVHLLSISKKGVYKIAYTKESGLPIVDWDANLRETVVVAGAKLCTAMESEF